MKVLIWAGCIFAYALVQVIITDSGIVLGGIPAAVMFFIMFAGAKALCRKWDENHPKAGEPSPQKEIPAE